MKQLSLWAPGEIAVPMAETNLRSPSACRAFSRARRLWRSLELLKPPAASSPTPCSARSSSNERSSRSKANTQGFSCKVVTEVNDLGRAIGEHHQNARYSDREVEMARNLRDEGYKLKEIAEMMDMPIRTVRGYLDGSRRSQSVAGWKKQKRWVKTKS